MLILGIESSCDETAAAVVRDGKIILSSVVASQVDVHRRYGGVVPELASRKHIEAIYPVVKEALERSGVSLNGIDAIAATRGPGLVGSLLIGLSFAKALSYARELPLIGVSHIEGHLLSIYLEEDSPSFPYVALMASGGHTALYYVSDYTGYHLLGQTRDDAAGEAFDKVAKLMGLGYPGGEVISRLAEQGNPKKINLPRAIISKDSFDFSFSGLKTAVANYIRCCRENRITAPYEDTAAAFQEAVVDVLTDKTMKAALQYKVKNIVAAGGVASNRRLREALGAAAKQAGIKVFIPDPSLCTDNAAMIAVAGYHRFRKGEVSDMDLDAYSRLSPQQSTPGKADG
ncbi:MAG: tRNA (adenosine(37)-N6)-threonylcarbamoyltransferase complex transferase subunit TsaD [Thermodesulfobacteriota bacterium]